MIVRKSIFIAAMAFAIGISHAQIAWAQCTKDTECKGDRICHAGVCVSPHAAGTTPPTTTDAPPPATTVPSATIEPPAPEAPPPPPPPPPPPVAPRRTAPVPVPVPPRPAPAYAAPIVAPAPVAAPRPGASTSAGADEAPQAHWLLGVDRLMGFHSWSATRSVDGVEDRTTTGLNGSFLWGLGNSDSLAALASQIPRNTLDYETTGHVTIGGSVAFYKGGSTTQTPTGDSVEGPTMRLLAFAPRLGYIIDLGRLAMLWPRIGITYYDFKESHTSSKGQTSSLSTTGLTLNVEPTLGLKISDYFALTAAAVIDIGLSGDETSDPPGTNPKTVTQKISNYGLTFGGVVRF